LCDERIKVTENCELREDVPALSQGQLVCVTINSSYFKAMHMDNVTNNLKILNDKVVTMLEK